LKESRTVSMPKLNHKKVTGLSGNEIYCLNKLNMRPGQLCIGNSVVSIGVAGGIGAGLSTLGGGEVAEITKLVHDGRQNAFNRMLEEAKVYGGAGITGVSFDLVNHGGNLEFITVGSTVHVNNSHEKVRQFSTSADAQEMYCQMDSGFRPLHFVFGNVAYSIGLGGSIGGAFRQLSRGEVPQFTEIFDKTRHLALSRIVNEAKKFGANSVVGIQTTISPLMGAQEMMMVGTASHHPALNEFSQNPVTSDMTNEEMWNMAHMGYMPLQLVMGVSVYSLGFTAGIASFIQSLGGGEVSGLTELLYEAREKALERIERDAELCGADEVVGVKTRVYDLGSGLVEFMAIGTAVKKTSVAKTYSEQLPPQAIIRDKDTFVDSSQGGGVSLSDRRVDSASKLQGGPFGIVFVIIILVFYVLRAFFEHKD
jgi:uncharacterized protein YbjQ (UPF0145 family)